MKVEINQPDSFVPAGAIESNHCFLYKSFPYLVLSCKDQTTVGQVRVISLDDAMLTSVGNETPVIPITLKVVRDTEES